MPQLTFATAEQARTALTVETKKELDKMYRDLYRQSKKKLNAIPKDSPTVSQKLQEQRLKQNVKGLQSAYRELAPDIGKASKAQMEKMAQAMVDANDRWLKSAGISIKGAYASVPTDIVNAIATGKIYDSNWSLSKAIWGNSQKTSKDINKVLAEGLAQNKSAYDIAKDLEKYVDPSAKKDWEWSKVYPGTAKKVDYNAQRLARTLISHAYQASLERVCAKNPFIDGYYWRSSGTERTCPICDDRDGTFFAKGDLPLDHPNGMCTFEANVEDLDKVAERLADWVNGKEDVELDAWLVDMTGHSAKPEFNDLQNKWLKPYGFSPTSMPKDFKEFAMALPFSKQTELLELAGGTWGDAHPYQVMEAYYKKNLMVVRPGVSAVVKEAKVKSSLTAESMESMFLGQKGTINSKLEENASAWWSKLNTNQREAIEAYTGSAYIDMNGYLRGLTQYISEYKEDYIRDAKSALSLASSPMDIVVGRGSSPEGLIGMLGEPKGIWGASGEGRLSEWVDKNKNTIVGSVIKDDGFLSTSPYRGGGFDRDITYRIFVPEGSHGAYIDQYSQHQEEKEFLLQAGGKFRVIDVEPGHGNNATIYLEYLKPKK